MVQARTSRGRAGGLYSTRRLLDHSGQRVKEFRAAHTRQKAKAKGRDRADEATQGDLIPRKHGFSEVCGDSLSSTMEDERV